MQESGKRKKRGIWRENEFIKTHKKSNTDISKDTTRCLNKSFDKKNTNNSKTAEDECLTVNGMEILKIVKEEQSSLSQIISNGNCCERPTATTKLFTDPNINSIDVDCENSSHDKKWMVHFADNQDKTVDGQYEDVSITVVPALDSETSDINSILTSNQNQNQPEHKTYYRVDSNEEKRDTIDLNIDSNPILYFNNGSVQLKVKNDDETLFVSRHAHQTTQDSNAGPIDNCTMAQESNAVSVQHCITFEPVKRRISDKQKQFLSPGDKVQFQISVNGGKNQTDLTIENEQVKQETTSGLVTDLGTTPVNSKRSIQILPSSTKSGIEKNNQPESINKESRALSEYKTAVRETNNNNDKNQLNNEIDELINYIPPQLVIPTRIDKNSQGNQLQLKTDSENTTFSDIILKMENARLHQLLIGVEQARAGTVNALIQVNSLLSNVQGENIKLSGDLKLVTEERSMVEESLSKVKIRASKSEEELFSLQQGVLRPDRTKQNSIDLQSKPAEFENSLKIIIDSWKNEKKELLLALSKSTTKAQHAENDVERLRVQFNRVKEQLEDSNSRFNKILEHNMRASQKVEEEMKNILQDKNLLADRLQEAKKSDQLIDELKREIEELKHQLEESNMEKAEFVIRMRELEQKNKSLTNECNELKDMEEHSQDIMEKLTENEESLREKISKEISEKNYLQDCLDETGQILLHLRNAERTLVEEKDNLEEDLDVEIQQNECLQHSLKQTKTDHKELVKRLENMTHVHVTVKESLQEANQKEKNYQQQINALTKSNHILHYSLEKAKEEKDDLREMCDSLEHEGRQFRSQTVKEQCEFKRNIDTLTEKNGTLEIENENLKKENNELRANVEEEEEDNQSLRRSQTRLEKHIIIIEEELTRLRQQRDDLDKEVADLRKKHDDHRQIIKSVDENNVLLTSNLEEKEETLEKISKNLAITKDNLERRENDLDEMTTRLKEKQRKIRDLELELEQITADKERHQNRVEKVDGELKELRRNNQEQKQEVGMFEFQVSRLKREKENFRHHADESKEEFEKHKKKCTETLQILREEIVGLKNQLIEKDRLAMKQKLNFQDAIDTSNTDLSMLRHYFNEQIHKDDHKSRSRLSSILATTESEKVDIEFLRNAHNKSQEEMLQHLNTLEDLKVNVRKENNDIVTVVQSPMSKIKLEEIKQLRNEMYDMKTEVAKFRGTLANTYEELMIMKLSVGLQGEHDINLRSRIKEVEHQLSRLNDAIADAELEQKNIIKRSTSLIRKAAREVNGESLDTANVKELRRKRPACKTTELSSIKKENHRLVMLIEMLKRRYNFDENDLQDKEIDEDESSVSPDSSRPSSPNYSTTTSFSSSNANQINLGYKLSDIPLSKTTERYCPPTSMRYPPRVKRTESLPRSQTSELTSCSKNASDNVSLISGERTGDVHYNSCGDENRPRHDDAGQSEFSLFSYEMSMFPYDGSGGAEILQRKLKQKTSGPDNESDSGSIRGRSGSVDDDSDYDPPPDEFKRTRTLPKGFKSK